MAVSKTVLIDSDGDDDDVSGSRVAFCKSYGALNCC